ncbi:hypothetical protein [Streptomyces sp. 150FB]|uniref:hypothetical protein n=1 Tax=Streptomyces sp. 150FB TaxID=1576605 RepID=UPI00191C0B79|nr:hypothetical protein [Streptomyces sp. 150FB]
MAAATAVVAAAIVGVRRGALTHEARDAAPVGDRTDAADAAAEASAPVLTER